MRKILLSFICFIYSVVVLSQKPAIDLDAINQFPEIVYESISNDGKFVSYITEETDPENAH